jgi:hypothetical protein
MRCYATDSRVLNLRDARAFLNEWATASGQRRMWIIRHAVENHRMIACLAGGEEGKRHTAIATYLERRASA